MKLISVISYFFIHFAIFSLQIKAVPQSRVIGGHAALSKQFPYAAAIHVQTRDSKFFCGGSLYFRQWIITAGQCVDGAIVFTIQLGSNKLEGDDPERVVLATSDYFLHPDYNPMTLENDVGLIRLRMEVELTASIQPITMLPTDPLTDPSYLRIFGWGQTSDDNSSLSDHLQYAYVTTFTNQECKAFYGSQIKDSMVCIEGSYNEGTCYGDMGSPLINIYGKNIVVNVGVASFVSGNGCESLNPSGYTRLYPFVDWIKRITST